MPLFTDSSLINLSDLDAFESTLSKIASTHNINIESKTAITLAAIGDRILARLIRAGSAESSSFNPVTTAGRFHIVSLPPQSAWYLTLDNVAVTEPLKRWICYELLSQIYAEAYNVQLNDRFREKWIDYSGRSKDTERSVYDLGIGVVYQPLGAPAIAQTTLGPGTLAAGIITVQTTWVDAAANESSASPLVPVTLPDSSSLTVAIVPAREAPPATAIGWNVYIGADGNPAARQNAAPIALTTVWTAPPSGFVSGPIPSNGQWPDCYVIDPQRLRRG
jgi:hypothetical protein